MCNVDVVVLVLVYSFLSNPQVAQEFLTQGFKNRTFVPISAIREQKTSALDSIDWITIGVIISSEKKVSVKACMLLVPLQLIPE